MSKKTIFIIVTATTIIIVIIDVLIAIPRPLIFIIISKIINIIGAAITKLMYISMNVSAALFFFSCSSLFSNRSVWALFSKNSGRSPPEFIVVASPLNNSESFLLGVLYALFLKAAYQIISINIYFIYQFFKFFFYMRIFLRRDYNIKYFAWVNH